MRKVLFITGLFLLLTTNTIAQDIKADELVDIASFVTNLELEVEDWEVTTKEKLNKHQIQDVISIISKNNDVTMSEDDDIKKYIIKDTHKQADVAVSYVVVIPKVNQFDAELIAVISGTSWNNTIKKDYQFKRNTMQNKLFTESAQTYTCLIAQDDGIMGSDVFLGTFTKKFRLQQKQTQFDTVNNSTHKKIIYGYTSLWEQKFSVNGNQMNVQVAVTQNENEHPKYTIGTPILINEY